MYRKTVVLIAILFFFLTIQSLAFATAVKTLYLTNNTKLMKEPIVVKCRVVKTDRFVAIIDIVGNNRYAGYYAVFGNWLFKKKSKSMNCITDGKYIVQLKAK